MRFVHKLLLWYIQIVEVLDERADMLLTAYQPCQKE